MFTDYFPPSRLNPGRAWFVAPLDDDRSGLTWNNARNKIQSAINQAVSGDVIYVAPGVYVEDVTIPFGLQVSIIGVGPFGSSILVGLTVGGTALTSHGDGTYIQNLWVKATDNTSTALRATCQYGRFSWCRLGSAGIGAASKCAIVGPGSLALVTATSPTQSAGIDNQFFNCQFIDGANGVILHGSDFGPATRIYFTECIFDRCSTKSIGEENLLGTVANQYRNLLVKDCTFIPSILGVEPTNYILLNNSNTNTGLVTGCRFDVSLTSGKNLVSTACLWTGNYHPAGLSTGQPS